MSPACVLVLVVLCIGAMILLTSAFKCNIFLSMFAVSLLLGLATLPSGDVVAVIKEGFGGTLKSIGVIIVLGIMIGLLLERSGATLSLALAILRLTGERRADWAIGLTGLVVGIPIFCDSGFVVLSGLNRSLVRKTGRPMAYMATLLALGLYSVHCLIPPHPGALAAAGLMRANIGGLIGAGVLLALAGVAVAFAWAYWIAGRESAKGAETCGCEPPEEVADGALPAAFPSSLPILVPLVLLSGRSALQLAPAAAACGWGGVLLFLGQPEVALLIGVGLAAGLCRRMVSVRLNELFDQAIDKTGPILVLTGAGGVFGAVIKATGVGDYAGQALSQSGLGLCIPFAVAAFLKTALGSTTVAMMTAASIIAPMLAALHLESDTARLLATLAMGAGSMIASHTNDSYFWVVTRFSGLGPAQTLRVFTTSTVVLGSVVFLAVWLCSLVFL